MLFFFFFLENYNCNCNCKKHTIESDIKNLNPINVKLLEQGSNYDKNNIKSLNEINDKSEEEKNKNREKIIIKFIIIDNIFLIIYNIILLVNKLDENRKNTILYFSIAISGNINYLFYIFFSLKKKQYISFTGFFSISTILLRTVELIDKFQNYVFQIISSLIGLMFSIIYIIKIIHKKKFKDLCEKFKNFKCTNLNIKINKKFISNLFLYFILLSIFIYSFKIQNFLLEKKKNNYDYSNNNDTNNNDTNNNDTNNDTIVIDVNKTLIKVYYYIYNYCYEESDMSFKYTHYMLKDSGNYSICVYGPKAKNGGRGGKICGEDFFGNNSQLDIELGGQEAGGEGGKGCGYFSGGVGYNGAGYCLVKNDYFLLVAGGGGGNSESGCKGGDVEKNGTGLFFGRGATSKEGGLGGDTSSTKERGTRFKGGSGESKNKKGKYCGGGGGSGYFGGGAGDWGDKGHDGGGGGGSNFCQARNCTNGTINIESDFSCYEIYAIKYIEVNDTNNNI